MPKGKYNEYSPKQKKIAAMAGDPKVLEGEDFKKLRKMKDGGMYKEYGGGGLHSEKKVMKTRGTGAATKGLNFHSSD